MSHESIRSLNPALIAYERSFGHLSPGMQRKALELTRSVVEFTPEDEDPIMSLAKKLTQDEFPVSENDIFNNKCGFDRAITIWNYYSQNTNEINTQLDLRKRIRALHPLHD